MEYLSYLKQPHFLALACAIVSCILVFVESKYSKTKYSYKHYLKICLIVVLNVYIVVILIQKGVIPIDNSCKTTVTHYGGGSVTSGSASSAVNQLNYNSVDIGNPNF